MPRTVLIGKMFHPMKEKNKTVGNKGEQIACGYLLNKGYKILARNWIYRHKEIDIIAKKNELLVIVEVKTRSSNFKIDPICSVSKQKQRFLIEAANYFVDLNDFNGEVQFDIIGIVLSENQHVLEHIDDAFYPLA